MPGRIDPRELEWAAPAPDRIVRLQQDGPDHLRFEDTRLDAARVEAALAAAGPGSLGPVAALHDGWRVAVLRPFRPLIYYCAFDDPDVFACLELSLRSLLERGRYRHEIAVVTSARDAPGSRPCAPGCGSGTGCMSCSRRTTPISSTLSWPGSASTGRCSSAGSRCSIWTATPRSTRRSSRS